MPVSPHPVSAEHHVRRPRLVDLLAEAGNQTTLVVAPAGTGKTSLVAGWAAESSTPTAWVSLRDIGSHTDGVRFWSAVIASLDTVAPGRGDRALATLECPSSRASAVDQLIDDLDVERRPPAVLVIDDFHRVDADELVARSVPRFVRNLPEWLRVVLVSRREPALPIDRMRSYGELGEIRLPELRFSSDEAVELMTRRCPALSPECVATAVLHADGWAAVLQLAAAAGGVDPGGGSLLRDYVLRDVLADEPPDVIEVLTAAAVAPRVNASLAHALTGHPDAGGLLCRAEARGVFLSRRGGDGWFGLHELVRQVLLADLASRSPRRLTELYGRAARWFEDAGDVVVALDRWVLADRPRDVLRLLSDRHVELSGSGRDATVQRMIEVIPAAVVGSDLASMVAYAWCHLLVDRRRFVELVEHLTWWVDKVDPNDVVRGQTNVLRAAAALVGGRWFESATLSRQAMLDLGSSVGHDPFGRFAANSIARSLALSEGWDDASDESRRAEVALRHDPERRCALESSRALGEALAGHPLAALRVAGGVRRATRVADLPIVRMELRLAEALAHRELGERARAATELAAVADSHAGSMLVCRVVAMSELAQAHLEEVQLEPARQILARAEVLVEEESLGVDVRSRLARVATMLALADGELDAARRTAGQIEDPFWGAVSRARVDLACHDRVAATTALDIAVPRCLRHEVTLALLRARAAVDGGEALTHATGAVEQACAAGIVQTVAAEGAAVLHLVEHAARRAPLEWLDQVRRCVADVGALDVPAGPAVTESVTERERDVLRFLPSRMTLREIADELDVSPNTLKFHLRVIYRKLGVNSRAAAAELARGMTRLRRPARSVVDPPQAGWGGVLRDGRQWPRSARCEKEAIES